MKIWPDKELEKRMLHDANYLDNDCACHIPALLQRIRELEAELKDEIELRCLLADNGRYQ